MAKFFCIVVVVVAVAFLFVQAVDEVNEGAGNEVASSGASGSGGTVKEESASSNKSPMRASKNKNVTVEGSVHGQLSKSKKRIKVLFRNFLAAVKALFRRLNMTPPSPPSSGQTTTPEEK